MRFNNRSTYSAHMTYIEVNVNVQCSLKLQYKEVPSSVVEQSHCRVVQELWRGVQ